MTYPPPTLVPRRSRAYLVRRIVVVVTLALLLGTCAVSHFLHSGGSGKDVAEASLSEQDDNRSTGASVSTGDLPAATVPAAAPAQPSPDARQPNHWYYVPQIGDGPGAIYSRSGGGWDYAFACTAPTRTLEFIAVNVGDPGTFDKQYMKVGRTKLMMDATWSKEGHGTISMKLAAGHPFFNAFIGPGPTLELELLAGRKTLLAIGPDVTRVIRECRAGGEEPSAAQDGQTPR